MTSTVPKTEPPLAPPESKPDCRAILDAAVRDEYVLRSLLNRARLGLKGRWGIDAEEVVQQAIAVALEKSHKYDPAKGPPLPWLQKFVGNVLLETCRKQIRFPSTGHDLTSHRERAGEFDADKEDIDEMRTRREKYLPLLSPQTRDVLRMRGEGLKDEEIANRLKTNRVNVRKIVSRGCETIQRLAADDMKGGLK